MITVIHEFKTIFQATGDTEYCSDEIELTEDMGFVNLLSREGIVCHLTEYIFKHGYMWLRKRAAALLGCY